MSEKNEEIKLRNLSVGARIAFIRKLRGMTQQELGNNIGIEGTIARNVICRYERTSRVPRYSVLQAIADALDTDVDLIKKYFYRDPMDIYFTMLWVEEVCPNFTLNKVENEKPQNDTHKLLMEKFTAWHRIRLKYQKGMITHRDYVEWKFARSREHGSGVRETTT